jgi:uncharacterized membrane protein (UPF0182 family)
MTTPIRELRPPRESTLVGRVLLIAALLVVVVVPVISGRLADWLWYRDLGFERVFLTKIAAQWSFALGAGLVALVVLYSNARLALRGVARKNLHIRDANEWAQAGPKVLAERFAAWLAPIVAVVLAIVVGLGSSGYWDDLARFWFRTPFGITDPVFNRDIAYYVFTVPFLQGLFTFANVVLTLALLMALVVYVARAEIGAVLGTGTEAWRFYATPRTQMHLATLGASMLVVAALEYLFVDIPSLLIARHPVLFGATYTDLNIRLPLMRVLAVIFVAGAVVLFVYARRAQLVRGAVVALVGSIGASFLFSGIVPATYQRLVVQPNELARETPQIRNHLSATRAAWGIENVDRRELSTGRQLTKRDIDANQPTIRNVRLWDREPLLQTYGQIQSIRTYYDFVSVDDDRYMVNGELRQVLLAPRELNTTAIPNRAFVNEHLTYTHGMGLTLGPSNQVTAEGLPVLWIKDLPPASSVSVRITKPQIYFGELANDFILAPTKQREIDYPSGQGGEAGDAAVYTQFAGGTGVSIGSFWRRLLFAFRFGSMNILLSDDLTAETRILFHRDVLERAQLALPFFDFDPDPFLIVTDDGRLEWMIDGYTVTDRYPYAQPLANGVNYMRNSVKVVIDAYTGVTRAYLADPNDPMIRTLGRIYPGLLRPMSEMPADVRAHVRYPAQLFNAQSVVYATFHMTDAETFYHREDQWQIPAAGGAPGGRVSADAFIRHIVMRLPGETTPEFILMRPFTPRQKDNLAAWMVARNDGEHYGKLRVYSFPRQSLVFGPAQIANRINQDTEVARQISLWDQRGSEVIRGELLVIPIEESLIYVQPLYLRAQGGRIPELKRVIVAHENQVAMEETLEAGLARLFGGVSAAPVAPTAVADRPTTAPTADTNAEMSRLLREANDTYERARSAQRAEDWATYGTEMRKLGELLRRLNASRPR